MNPESADTGGVTAEKADGEKRKSEGDGPTSLGAAGQKPTKKLIRAAFREVFGDVAKAKREAQRMTAAKRLKPYRAEVLKLRAAGFSWRKIAEGMRKPRIGVPATPDSLKAAFGAFEKAANAAKQS